MLGNCYAGVVRTLSVFFIVWTIFGPIDSDLIRFKMNFLSQSTGVNLEIFWILRVTLALTSVVLMRSPHILFLSGIQLVVGSLFLHLGVVSNSLWNYNTHIIIISFLTFLTGLRSHDKRAEKDLATALSLVFATIYFQAAISKLVVSGMDWMNSGLSIYMHMLKFNPSLANWINGDIILFKVAGWLTVMGELVLGVLFVIPKTRTLAAVISVTFHIMLWCTFQISFWHLWIFYPVLVASWRINLERFRVQIGVLRLSAY